MRDYIHLMDYIEKTDENPCEHKGFELGLRI